MQDLKNLIAKRDSLKSTFDDAIQHNNSFENVKKIYMELKAVENAIIEIEDMHYISIPSSTNQKN